MIPHISDSKIEDDLVTEKTAAAFLNKNPKTLYRWRQNGVSPKYVKLPTGSILYRLTDLKRFISDNTTPSLLWG